MTEKNEQGIDARIPTSELDSAIPSDRPGALNQPLSQLAASADVLQNTSFWSGEKAVLILSGTRQIWLEATSNPSLTLRAPHGSALGVDLVRGRFVTEEVPGSRTLVDAR